MNGTYYEQENPIDTTRVREVYAKDLEFLKTIEDGQILAFKLYRDAKKEFYNVENYTNSLIDFDLKFSLDNFFRTLEYGMKLPSPKLLTLSDLVEDDHILRHIKPFLYFDTDKNYLVKERYELVKEIGRELEGCTIDVTDEFWNEPDLIE